MDAFVDQCRFRCLLEDLLGVGFDELSMSVGALPRIHWVVRNIYRNGDNRVSHSEYNQWINRQAGSQFDRIDVDRDGVISRSEMSYFDTSN